jgi:uncharacterized protein (DUF924 family)
MATTQEILDFWFGELDEAGSPPADRAALWWGGDTKTDAELRERFEADVVAAAAGQRDDWAETPQGALALLICLDQLSRNIYRDTPRSFEQDGRARYVAMQGIDAGLDRQLAPIQRVFFYMPLEHAEDQTLQRRSVELFETLHSKSSADQRETFRNYLEYAERHRDVVARFGRFPHRNAILGRDSTEEERTFLAGPGAPF